ncbi:MAG: hydrogen gas-evolving membrane-bound hydrogenase subunit E [Croceibacterium sp.]
MTNQILVLLDLVLALLLVGLVAAALGTRNQARMVMLFVAFGGLLALVWVRLRAPDVALAEAAIGSALTGGLLLRARTDLATTSLQREVGRALKVVAGVASGAVFLALTLVFLSMEWPRSSPVAIEVSQNLSATGVSNPVTAVLLNYRAYDTLLEIAVLLTAAIGIWMLRPRASVPSPLKDDPMFLSFLRVVVPLLCLFSGYLLWLGAFAPGGAFQAGAMLAAALLLLLLAGVRAAPGAKDSIWLRGLLSAGLLMFVVVAAAMTLEGRALLQFPVSHAKYYILAIEAMLTVSIALTLLTLFVGGRPSTSMQELQ